MLSINNSTPYFGLNTSYDGQDRNVTHALVKLEKKYGDIDGNLTTNGKKDEIHLDVCIEGPKKSYIMGSTNSDESVRPYRTGHTTKNPKTEKKWYERLERFLKAYNKGLQNT